MPLLDSPGRRSYSINWRTEDSRLRTKRVVVFVAGAAAVLLVSSVGFFYFRDNFSTHYPIKAISALTFRSGEIPYWNFHDGGGQPLAGNPNTLTFYPDNFLYLFLPAHLAFNLHFLLHLIGGWFAMRALSRSTFGAWMYALSGLAVSVTAFYNMVVAFALVPLALWAAQRGSVLLLGGAFGLMALAGEPVTIVAAAIAVAIVGRMRPLRLAAAVVVALIIASPQIIAWGEIAGEVERARGYSATTALNASLEPARLIEIVAVPFRALGDGQDLFITLFLGIIVVPALLQRSRWTLVAAVTLFLALGRFNPVVRWLVESFEGVRIVRYPEKFAIVLVVAFVVLSARYYERSARKRAWALITIVPLVASAIVMVPIDLFTFYEAPRVSPQRLYRLARSGGQTPSRSEYRDRARRLEPLFGAVAGLRYAVNRSGDGMHSVLSRIAAERVAALPVPTAARYLRIAGCSNIPDALPPAMFARDLVIVPTVTDAVRRIESPAFDERATVVVPHAMGIAPSSVPPRIIAYRETGQTIRIVTNTAAPALLFVNQSYFSAWVASSGERELEILPVDLDRLGIIVPAGQHEIALRFGRHRTLAGAAWLVSLVALTAFAVALRIESLDRGAGEVERAGNDDAPMP